MSSGDHRPSLRASPARKARAEGVRVRPGGDQQLQSSGVLREGLLEEPRRYCSSSPEAWTASGCTNSRKVELR